MGRVGSAIGCLLVGLACTCIPPGAGTGGGSRARVFQVSAIAGMRFPCFGGESALPPDGRYRIVDSSGVRGVATIVRARRTECDPAPDDARLYEATLEIADQDEIAMQGSAEPLMRCGQSDGARCDGCDTRKYDTVTMLAVADDVPLGDHARTLGSTQGAAGAPDGIQLDRDGDGTVDMVVAKSGTTSTDYVKTGKSFSRVCVDEVTRAATWNTREACGIACSDLTP